MKVIILAGGFGTRLSEYTEDIPKPMVAIGGKPILLHLMEYYASYGHEDFFIALGYKAEKIKDYFLRYNSLNSDFSIDFSTGEVSPFNKQSLSWTVNLIDTGLNSMTGGRVKRLQEYIGNETCMLTYGDGLSDIDLNRLLNFHKNHGKLVTVSAVRPSARFGELDIDKNGIVSSFKEKPQTEQGWINGGFFIIEPRFFEYIENDNTVLENEPLTRVANEGELVSFKHEGFWQCMDTKRDRDYLENLEKNERPPWKK